VNCTLVASVACLASCWLTAMPEVLLDPTPLTDLSVMQEIEWGDRLYPLARSITVKVFADRNTGSGILIQRQGTTYTVLTNRHVLTAGSPYAIQTPDGRRYPARVLKRLDFAGNDLRLVEFDSHQEYAIAPLGAARDMPPGEPLISAGFPQENPPARDAGFLLTRGQVSLNLSEAMVGGYQLGYTNPIYQGMSGGPVLNQWGEVVGINSLRAYPLWGNPYVFADGSSPAAEQRSQFVHSSWAVPMETFLCLLPRRWSASSLLTPATCRSVLKFRRHW